MVNLSKLRQEMEKEASAESRRPISESVLASINLVLITAIEDLQTQVQQLADARP